MATIKDVARLAGVSVSTVSIVLNTTMEERRVSAKTWMEVHNAMDALNYKPSTAARKLRKNVKQTPTIGLFWPMNHQSYMLGDTLTCIQNAFDRAYFKCSVVVYMYSLKHLSECTELVKGESLEGAVICLPGTEDMEWLENTDIKIPIVLFNRQVKKYNFVRSDNRAMGRRAARLLLDASCMSAALFYIKDPDRGIKRRLEDFIDEYSTKGTAGYREYTFDNDLDFEAVIQQTENMIKNGIPEAAVYFAGEQTAYTSIYYLMKKNFRVPEDIKVVLVNVNLGSLFRYISPTLTLVTSAADQMLTDCVQILIYQMKEANQLPIHKIYAPEIYYGETFPAIKTP